jgi:uncharacterized phage-associated protein
MTAVSVHDVAAYIIQEHGPMTAMKMQKLVYYSQAWGLVWDSEPLFAEPIQAWSNGPVVPSLYDTHRGMFAVTEWPKGDPSNLSKSQIGTIDAVLRLYGSLSAHQLSELTHREEPWKNARNGMNPGERGSTEISHAEMVEYYSSLV